MIRSLTGSARALFSNKVLMLIPTHYSYMVHLQFTYCLTLQLSRKWLELQFLASQLLLLWLLSSLRCLVSGKSKKVCCNHPQSISAAIWNVPNHRILKSVETGLCFSLKSAGNNPKSKSYHLMISKRERLFTQYMFHQHSSLIHGADMFYIDTYFQVLFLHYLKY